MTVLRALIRLSWRTILKNKLRSGLVFLLMMVLVAAGTAVGTISRTTSPSPEEREAARLGTADLVATWYPDVAAGGFGEPESRNDALDRLRVLGEFDPAAVEREIAAEIEGAVAITREGRIDQPGVVSSRNLGFRPFDPASLGFYGMTDADVTDPLAADGWQLIDGRAPTSESEVAVSRRQVVDNELTLGTSIEIGGQDFELVGVVVDPTSKWRSVAVATPGGFDRVVAPEWYSSIQLAVRLQGAERDRHTPASQHAMQIRVGALFEDHLPQGSSTGFGSLFPEAGVALFSPGERPSQQSTLVTALLSVQVGLIAASAFAIGVRRRTVEFGQLLTTGADGAQIRALVLVEAAILGIAGSLAGAGLGAGVVWAVARQGWLTDFGDRYAPSVVWNPVDWVGPALVAVVASIVAAWWPARTVSRLPVTAALAGRVPTPSPQLKTPLLGVVGLVIGSLITAGGAAMSWSAESQNLPVAVSIVGLCMLFDVGLAFIGHILAFVGRRADRLAVKARLVVRNSDRQRSRAWAAVAAFVIVLGVPVMAAAGFEANALSSWGDPDPRAVSIDRRGIRTDADLTFEGPSGVPIDIDEADVALAAEFDQQLSERIVQVARPRASTDLLTLQDTFAWSEAGGGGAVGVATPELLAALGISEDVAAQLDKGSALWLPGESGGWAQAGGGVADTVYLGRAGLGTASDPGLRVIPVATSLGDSPLAWTPSRPVQVLVLPEVAETLGIDVIDGVTVHLFAEPISVELNQQIWAEVDSVWDEFFSEVPPPAAFGRLHVAVGYVDRAGNEWARWIVLAAAAGLAALIALITAALAAVEVDRDLASMIASGAPPSIRRWLLGAQTAYHLLIAAAIAVPLALLIMWATGLPTRNGPGYDGDPTYFGSHVIIPWSTVALVVVVVPLVVGALIAIVFRSGAPAVSRRFG